ncbi:related to stress response protein rds1p [Sporisorium reilianum SRZ2]|uniref:Related to stress response protein rds1p n=1 Tax=Sporisorium reilianum (strain SRZ2) TaxID=999809 RepID=E6ZLE4_SPORE|nr:related to stress response protein rds1p [Sporisorium reilianum SRZ2]
MKLTLSFVLALAAASSATASPLVRRQQSATSALGNLPTPSAVLSSAGSIASIPTSVATRSASSASPAAPSTTAVPTPPTSPTTFNDTQILQYALTLEHLEATFYNQSLSKLSAADFEDAGYNASVRNRIYSIGRDEAAHVELLTKALGNASVPACTYSFSSVTDVPSFLTTARVLEGVGVSAYLGAAQNVTEKSALETAGSILVVEGQHQAYLIAQTNDGGNSIPSPFATPLDFKQVYSLAAPFIASCPQNASLPITAFPTLSLTGGAANGSFTPGQQVTVSYNASNTTSTANQTYLAVIQGVAGAQFVPLTSGSGSQVSLPANLTGGQMYAVVTSSNGTVTDDNTLAGPAVGYVNVPLPQAPDATSTGSASSSAASGVATATASGSDSIVSSAPASSSTGSASSAGAASTSQALAPSLASLGSANVPQPTASN